MKKFTSRDTNVLEVLVHAFKLSQLLSDALWPLITLVVIYINRVILLFLDDLRLHSP